MRIALFDYDTIDSNPYGKGVLRVLEALCERHEFTVYSTRFDNPRPDQIEWRRVPVVHRPLLGLFLSFHLSSAAVFAYDKFARGRKYDLIQTLETASLGADVVCAQFCHRAYLRTQWSTSRPGGVRRVARRLYESCAAMLEPRVFRKARLIVVPSRGLAAELVEQFPIARGKTIVVPNAVDSVRARADARFDRDAFRRQHGLATDKVLLAFVALGHFERKGLPLVIDALRSMPDLDVQIVVVGGSRDLVAHWTGRVRDAGLAGRICFVGHQSDPRSFLWAADGFVFPSAYETFSYVSFEAAAAGLPVIVSRLHGVEEFLRDGENGLLVERDSRSIAAAMSRLIAMGTDGRAEMGRRARRAVESFDIASHTAGWSAVYDLLDTA